MPTPTSTPTTAGSGVKAYKGDRLPLLLPAALVDILHEHCGRPRTVPVAQLGLQQLELRLVVLLPVPWVLAVQILIHLQQDRSKREQLHLQVLFQGQQVLQLPLCSTHHQGGVDYVIPQ